VQDDECGKESGPTAAILSPPSCRASTLNPAASLFPPRVTSSVQDAPRQ